MAIDRKRISSPAYSITEQYLERLALPVITQRAVAAAVDRRNYLPVALRLPGCRASRARCELGQAVGPVRLFATNGRLGVL
jgi:hypothetical protein